MRHNLTDAEKLLWSHLKSGQLNGCKFRRQHPVGPYIVDFACISNRLIVELDGGQHAGRKEYDDKRTAFLEEKGYRVIRFWNNDVMENTDGVLQSILEALA